eukprot:scaffold1334_cov344-Prasinococcus_capsulatus_cf.AAC.14
MTWRDVFMTLPGAVQMLRPTMPERFMMMAPLGGRGQLSRMNPPLPRWTAKRRPRRGAAARSTRAPALANWRCVLPLPHLERTGQGPQGAYKGARRSRLGRHRSHNSADGGDRAAHRGGASAGRGAGGRARGGDARTVAAQHAPRRPR